MASMFKKKGTGTGSVIEEFTLVKGIKSSPYYYTGEKMTCGLIESSELKDGVNICQVTIISSEIKEDIGISYMIDGKNVEEIYKGIKVNGKATLSSIENVDKDLRAERKLETQLGADALAVGSEIVIKDIFQAEDDIIYVVATKVEDDTKIYFVPLDNLSTNTSTAEVAAPKYLEVPKNNYVISPSERAGLFTSMVKVLDRYNYCWEEEAINKILDVHYQNKLELLNILSNNPKWDRDRLQLQTEQTVKRRLDYKQIKIFFTYFRDRHDFKSILVKELINGKTKEQVSKQYTMYQQLHSLILEYENSEEIKSLLGGHTLEEIVASMDSLSVEYKQFKGTGEGYTRESYAKYEKFNRYIDELTGNTRSNFIDETLSKSGEERLNGLIPELKVAKGQKVSRVIGKFCKLYEFDKIKITETVTEPVRNEDGSPRHGRDGQTILHSVEKSICPYEREFAKLSDALSPKVVTQPFIISLNPVDYLTMSFGNSWCSCHTIDTKNIRGIGNGYSGSNALGTMSYLLDKVSIITYTIGDKKEGEEFEFIPKIERCMFHYEAGKILQARVYPQELDSGGDSVYTRFRNTVLSELSTCFGISDAWETVDKEYVSSYVKTVENSSHYTDYTNNSNVNISAPIGFYLQEGFINIGHISYCLTCGREKDNSSKSRLSCCFDNSKETKKSFEETKKKRVASKTTTATTGQVHTCPVCNQVINSGSNSRVINGQHYHEHCTFYCAAHEEYEPTNLDSYGINGLGIVCEAGLDEVDYNVCEECGEYTTAELIEDEDEDGDSILVCRNCYDINH